MARQEAAPCSRCVPCRECQGGQGGGEDFGEEDYEEEEEEEEPQPQPRRTEPEEEEEDDDDEVNIDDGLLDEVFEDLPGNSQAKSQPAPRSKVTRSARPGQVTVCRALGAPEAVTTVSWAAVTRTGRWPRPQVCTGLGI